MPPHSGEETQKPNTDRDGYSLDVLDDPDFFKDVVNNATETAKSVEESKKKIKKEINRGLEAGLSMGLDDERNDFNDLLNQKRLFSKGERKAIMEDILAKLQKIPIEKLPEQKRKLEEIVLDKNKMRSVDPAGRAILRRMLRYVDRILENDRRLKVFKEKQAEEQESAGEIFERVLKDPEYISEIFRGDDIEVKNLKDIAEIESDEDFSVKFGEGEDAHLLICKSRVTSKEKEEADKFKWFAEVRDLTMSEKRGEKNKNKPIYVNLILQREHLKDLQESITDGKHREDLVKAVRSDLEMQMGVIILNRVRTILKGREEEIKNIEKYFKEGMTGKNRNFSATVEEFEKYIEENFPEIKNDPIINNALKIAGRLNFQKKDREKSEEIA